MRRTAQLFTSVVVTTFLWQPVARPQDQQWLQYRSAGAAREIVPDMGYQDLEPSPAKPPGVKLPQFQSGRPLFLVWRTPMVASGRISKTTALREEADEPELRSKPRLMFAYDRGHAGRLNELILAINRMGQAG